MPNTYTELSTPELELLRLKASNWLKENQQHIHYKTGLDRYIEITRELRNRKRLPEVSRIMNILE